jgi:hypothetical protein
MTGGGPDTVTLRLATRGSALALWQADHVTALLHEAAAAAGSSVLVEKVIVETMADQRLDIPIDAMGGKGVFVKEIQAAVLDGRADLAVHSGKDLPALTPPELVIAAVPERGDVRDVLVGSTVPLENVSFSVNGKAISEDKRTLIKKDSIQLFYPVSGESELEISAAATEWQDTLTLRVTEKEKLACFKNAKTYWWLNLSF